MFPTDTLKEWLSSVDKDPIRQTLYQSYDTFDPKRGGAAPNIPKMGDTKQREGLVGNSALLTNTLGDIISASKKPSTPTPTDDFTPDTIKGLLETKFGLEKRGANVRMGMANQDRFGTNIQAGAMRMMGLG